MYLWSHLCFNASALEAEGAVSDLDVLGGEHALPHRARYPHPRVRLAHHVPLRRVREGAVLRVLVRGIRDGQLRGQAHHLSSALSWYLLNVMIGSWSRAEEIVMYSTRNTGFIVNINLF